MKSGSLAVLSYNVKGLGLNDKRQILFEKIEKLKEKFDIIFLQETHMDHDIFEALEEKWKVPSQFFWSKETTKRGTAILILNPQITVIQTLELTDRCIRLNIQFEGRHFLLINSYFPSERSERKAYLENLSVGNEDSIIWGGDFNFVENQDDTSGNFDKTHSALFKAVREANGSGLQDAITFTDSPPQRTFKHVGLKYEARLDRFYISSDIAVFFKSLERAEGWYRMVGDELKNFSDHWPIALTLSFRDLEFGKGYWKLNTSLLSLHSAKVQIAEEIQKSSHLPPLERLSRVNFKARKIFQEIGKQRANLKRSMLLEIESLKQSLLAQNAPLDEIEKLEMKKEAITLPDEKFKMRQLKISLDSFEDIPSKYLSNRLKAQAANTTIETLLNENDELVVNLDEILEESALFYESLFNVGDSSRKTRQRYLRRLKRKIKPNDTRTLERRITAKEVSSLIQSMKSDSSPGEDGLPYEYYKEYSELLSPLLADSFNEILKNPSMLPQEWKNGVIKLLFKKGDRKLLSNWRPITLLNTIFKLFTGILNKRLIPLIKKIIHPNQKGFVQGRYILDQVLTVKTVRELNKEGYIAFLDFEKAFDRVNHNLLFETLAKLGFSDLFISLIRALVGGSSRVLIRGFFSRPFQLQNGVRQGDTISPTLFILVIEGLAVNIREDGSCTGVKVSHFHFIRILLFADDVCLLASTKTALALMLDHVEKYNEANKGKINKSKCCIIPLNVSDLDRNLFGIPLMSPLASERYLGYEFFFDKNKSGLETVLKKFENRLLSWKNLHLSLFGKANVLRTYAFPLLHYTTALEDLTKDQEKRLRNLTSWFLFSYESTFAPGKSYKSRISSSRLSDDLRNGGLNLVPIDLHAKAQKVNWALRVFQRKSVDGWVHSFSELLNHSKGSHWDIPVEMSMIPPQAILRETERKTIKGILLAWFSVPKRFDLRKSPFVGSWSNKNVVVSVYKTLKLEGQTICLLSTKNQKGSISVTENEVSRSVANFVPVRVIFKNGKLEFHGPIKKRTLFKQSLLGCGTQILKASFKSVVDTLSPPEVLTTEKQKEWTLKFPGFISNFSLLLSSQLRLRVQSHCFSRFANSLPREREGTCPRCKIERESSDHVLFQCSALQKDAQKTIDILGVLFNAFVTVDNFLTLLNSDPRVRIFQMIAYYCSWTMRCKTKFENKVHDKAWENLFSSEIKRFLLKILHSNPSEDLLTLWKPLILNYDPNSLTLNLVPFFPAL